jgi:type I restriction enzyme S subunit
LSGEISARDRTAPYKGVMFAAYPGDIVFSRIDARNGAIGVLPPEIAKAVVTPEFPVFIPDPERLDGEFVKFVLRTGGFLAALRTKASGTSGRKRITPEVFLDLRIPLSSLADQRAIAAAYRVAVDGAAALEREARETEAKAAEAFETGLGVFGPKPLPDRRMLVASFKDLERWSHDAILRKQHPDDRPSPKYPMSPLSSVADVVYGMQKHPGNRPGKHARSYLRVANVQRGRLVLDEIKYIDVSPIDFARLKLEDRDLLFVEGNGSRENLGRVALWRNEIEDCIHQNHLIRARLDQSRVFPVFAAHWFNSDAGRAHFFEEGKTTSGLGTINSSVVKCAPIPLAPTDVQEKLVAAFDAECARASSLREQAVKARAQAWADFEPAIYAAGGIAEALATR